MSLRTIPAPMRPSPTIPSCIGVSVATGLAPFAEDEAVDGVRKALLVVRGRDMPRGAVNLAPRLPHRNRETRLREHEDVVRHVAYRGDLVLRDREFGGEVLHDAALVRVGVRHVEVVVLGA